MYPAFLEPYDKIIYLRKKYKITQKQLAGDNYSQAYVTKLETKKQAPTAKNLQHFACRLNEIFKERNIPEVIHYEDLKKTKDQSIKEFYENKLNDVKKLNKTDTQTRTEFERIITDLKLFENHLDHKQKFYLFIEIGEKAFEFEEFDIAKTYSFNFILEAIFLKNIDEMQRGLILLTRACILSEDYNYISELQNLLEPYFEKFKPHNKEVIYLNLSLIYTRLESYNTSLQYLDKINKEVQIQKHPFKKEINKAIIYRRLQMFDKAEKIYLNLIKKKDRDSDTLIWAKTNLLVLYSESNDLLKLKKNYYFVKKRIHEDTSNNLKRFLYILALSANILNKKKDAITFFNTSLNKNKTNALEEEEVEISYNCIKELLLLYKRKDLGKVLDLESRYFELTSKKSNPNIGYEFINYYTRFKCYENLREFLSRQEVHFEY